MIEYSRPKRSRVISLSGSSCSVPASPTVRRKENSMRLILTIIGVVIGVIVVVILFATGAIHFGGAHNPKVTITTTQTTPNPQASPPAVSPFPGPATSGNGGTTAYPIDGQVHVYVDLNKVIHDNEYAAFSFTAVNGTSSTIEFSEAAVAVLL